MEVKHRLEPGGITGGKERMKGVICSNVLLVQLLVLFAVCGCNASNKLDVTASDKLMSGDLARFLEDQITRNGGRLAAPTNVITPINCSWRFRSDTNGAQVFMDAKLFAAVDGLFKVSVGTPDIATEKLPGRFFVGYNIRRAGVAIQYMIAPSPFHDVPDPLLHILILKQQNLF